MKSEKLHRDKAWLEEQYNGKLLSTVHIAKLAGCSLTTVQYWMDKYGIRRRSLSEARQQAFVRGDLVPAPREPKPYHDKEWLYSRYITEGLTITETASEADRSASTILRWLRVHGIQTRSTSEVVRDRWAHGDFDGIHDRPSFRHKQSEARKAAWERGAYDDPSIRGKQSIASKAMWKMGLCDHIFTPEFRTKVSGAVKTLWAQGHYEGVHDKIAIGIKEAWERGAYDDRFTPEVRDRLSASLKQAWKNGLYDDRDISGENHPRWLGGISFEPYPPTFNKEFKKLIRTRDDQRCAICRLSGRCVHHINYVKDDTTPDNCITLCRKCHSATNANRACWQSALTQLVQARLSLQTEI